jgi:hypothetical protein
METIEAFMIGDLQFAISKAVGGRNEVVAAPIKSSISHHQS